MGFRVYLYAFDRALPECLLVLLIQRGVKFLPVPAECRDQMVIGLERGYLFIRLGFPDFFLKLFILLVVVAFRDPSLLKKNIQAFQFFAGGVCIAALLLLSGFKLHLGDFLFQPGRDMGQHVVLDLVFCQTGAAVTVKLIPAPVFYVYAFAAVLKLLFLPVPCKIVPADRALDQGRKDVWIVTTGGVCLRGSDLPELPELLPCDVRFAVVKIIFIASGVSLIFEQAVYFIAGRGVVTVFFEQIVVGTSDRVAGAVIVVGVVHDIGDVRILYQPVIDHFVAVAGAHAARNLADRPLIVKNRLDALGGAVTLRLIDREHDVDDHLPVGGGRIIIFKDRLPVTVVRLQDFLCDVVVLDVAEPSVQLGDKDHVDLILLHVLKETQEPLAVLHGLAGGDSLIGVAIYDCEAVTLRVLGERLLLGREGEAVEVLFFGADTDVDGTAFDFRHGDLLFNW